MGNPPCKAPANHCTPPRHRQRHCIPARHRQDQSPPEAPPEKSPARHRQNTQTQGTHKRNCDRCPPCRFDFTCEISSVTSTDGSRKPPHIYCTIQAICPSIAVRQSLPLPPQVFSSISKKTKKTSQTSPSVFCVFPWCLLNFAPWWNVVHFQQFQNACLFLCVCLCLFLRRSSHRHKRNLKNFPNILKKFWHARQVTEFISQVK